MILLARELLRMHLCKWRGTVGGGICVMAVLAALVSGSRGQAPVRKVVPPTKGIVPPGKAPPGVQPKTAVPMPATMPKKGKELPKPEDVSLETKDGVSLKATFYAGSSEKESKDSVP